MHPENKAHNINNNYFKGFYKEIWRSVIPDELTVKEIGFMQEYFKLKSGSKVLDIMCGYGRHAIGLANRGINVTAVDNLDDYISEIILIAQRDKIPLTAVCEDILQFKSDEVFDLAICMGNSLNFFDAEETQNLLSMISGQLRPGGSFLINTWSIAEIAARNFKEKSWSKIGELTFLTDCKFLFHPSRIEIESIIIAADGSTETKKAVDYIFSLNELEKMLNHSGFILKDNFSIPGKKRFSIGEARAYIIAEKR